MTTLADLVPDPQNARRHTPRNVGLLQDSLQEVGAARSIVIDENNVVLAGNATVEAAGIAGIERVQIVDADGETIVAVRRSNLTAEQKTRLALFDNRTAELAEWDEDVLAELSGSGFDLSNLWHEDELAALLAEVTQTDGGLLADADPDAIPDASDVETRCKSGDIWQLGRHRLMCGDSTDTGAVALLMGGERVDCMLTDPPYGVGDTASVKNNYDIHEDTKENLRSLIDAVLPIGMEYARRTVLTPGNGNQPLYPEPSWTMAWFIPGGVGKGPWGFCSWQPVLCYGKDPRLEHGEGCYPDALVLTEAAENVSHPCSKPVNVWKWLMERVTARDGDVFDPFIGSGTTLVAAEMLGRRCFGVELSPAYCDVTIARWERATGQTAVLLENVNGPSD